MIDWNLLAFLIFPYLALTTFVVGHAFRYVTDPFHWNAKSSELLEKGMLKYAPWLFHYGIVLTFVGHFGGLLIPQSIYDAFGVNGRMHTSIAFILGILFGLAALLGNFILLVRRFKYDRLRTNSSVNDVITGLFLFLVIGLGAYNVFFGHYYVLDSIAPWIRGIVIFTPDPGLMAGVPLSYKLHILSALALLAFSPFSRLIHIWSLPLPYLFRSFIVFRKRRAAS